MDIAELKLALSDFAKRKGFSGKGALSVALVVTQHARSRGLPLNPEDLITGRSGQVQGLGKAAVQAILKRHGIHKVLAAEGGRTSRGSIGNMRDYVEFLSTLSKRGSIDLDAVESFWIEQVNRFFSAKPFKIRMDSSRSLTSVVRDMLGQAEERQKNSPGSNVVGAVLQYIVGAKLESVYGLSKIQHYSYTTADAPSGRSGDFFLGDVAVHVTATPSEALVQKCQQNLDDGIKPIIVTTSKGLAVARGLAENCGLTDRIDSFEIEQFVALNLYEIGEFRNEGRRKAISDLVSRYNAIVESVDTDPSLRIEIRK